MSNGEPNQEERIAQLEMMVEEQVQENEKLWAAIVRLDKRTENLRLAVPHVKFEEW